MNTSPVTLWSPSLPGVRVLRVLEDTVHERGLPEAIQVDNGPEFIGRAVEHAPVLQSI